MHDIDTKGLHACDHKLCEEYALVNANGTLKNVLVYLEGAPPADGAALPAVVVSQSHCQYVPHVVALRVGQKLTVRSNDDTIHNVQGQPRANPAFNFSQTKAGAEHTLSFKAPEIFSLRCDVHPWMQAYVGVFDNGFFALTGDDGAFEITGIPSGQYTLTAWHEHFDTLRQSVTLSDDKPVQADFTYEP
jgi:plastocyanin